MCGNHVFLWAVWQGFWKVIFGVKLFEMSLLKLYINAEIVIFFYFFFKNWKKASKPDQFKFYLKNSMNNREVCTSLRITLQ